MDNGNSNILKVLNYIFMSSCITVVNVIAVERMYLLLGSAVVSVPHNCGGEPYRSAWSAGWFVFHSPPLPPELVVVIAWCCYAGWTVICRSPDDTKRHMSIVHIPDAANAFPRTPPLPTEFHMVRPVWEWRRIWYKCHSLINSHRWPSNLRN